MRDPQKRNRMCHLSVHLAFWLQIISLTLVIHGYSVTGAAPPNNVPHFRSRDEEPQRPPVKYKYSYTVRGIEGDQHGHQASHDGPFASGKYYVKLNQGTSQNVEYYTDQLGYHPKVEYRSQLDSGNSGARVVLGGNANSYSTSTIKNDSNEYTSTEISPTPAEATTAKPADFNTAQPTFESATGSINPNFGLRVTDDTPFGSNGTTINSYFGYTLNPSDATPTNQTNVFFSTPTDPPNALVSLAQAANVPADAYLQPEYNEITNGFLSKIVSVVPGIKFLRPIIVTDAAGQMVNGSADLKSDQVVDSAQLHELHQASPYARLILAGVSVLNPKNESISELTAIPEGNSAEQPPQEPEKLKTIVDVEPQTIEKQAVITTNIDISKSVPLTMNFLPEVDNNLSNLNEQRTNGLNYPSNELISSEQQRPIFGYPPINGIPASNPIPSINYQPGAIFGQPRPLEAALANYPVNENPQGAINSLQPQLSYVGPSVPQGQYAIGPAPQALFGTPPRFFHLPFAANLPQAAPNFMSPQNAPPLAPPDYRFVSIPILQHQPNIIPLNYADTAQQVPSELGPAPTNSPPSAETESAPSTDPVSEAESAPTQETIIKRENYSSDKANSIEQSPSKPIKPSFIEPAFYSPQPLAYHVPAAQLIPYVKQITNSPQMLQVHPYTHFFRQQQQQQPQQPQLQLRSGPVRAHSVSYSVRQFPKEQYRKPHLKSAPFKPSHPVWDSIYPPQHMYQVPYYVIDKIPNDRKARDSGHWRNQRRVRRLFVEYGGFKPPMIPSTLLEVEETSDSTEVPTNAAES